MASSICNCITHYTLCATFHCIKINTNINIHLCKSDWTGWWKVMKLKWHTAGRVQIASSSSLHLQITCIYRGGDGIVSSPKEQQSSSIALAMALWLVVSREVDVIAHQMNRTGQSRVHATQCVQLHGVFVVGGVKPNASVSGEEVIPGKDAKLHWS